MLAESSVVLILIGSAMIIIVVAAVYGSMIHQKIVMIVVRGNQLNLGHIQPWTVAYRLPWSFTLPLSSTT